MIITKYLTIRHNKPCSNSGGYFGADVTSAGYDMVVNDLHRAAGTGLPALGTQVLMNVINKVGALTN